MKRYVTNELYMIIHCGSIFHIKVFIVTILQYIFVIISSFQVDEEI